MRNFKPVNTLAVMLLAAMPFVLSAQGTTITGQVVDGATLQALPGANMVVANTPYGASTDEDGNYSIDLPASMAVGQEVQLSASFIGYKSSTATITLSGGTVTEDFELEVDPIGLEEIVAVGYGTARMEELTGSISFIGAEQLEQIPTASFQDVLQGNPGLQVVSNDGAPGGAISVRIRGIGSISAGNEPLYVIDGIPITSGSVSTTDFSNGGRSSNVLASINPNDIESIVVLKDAASTAIYGSRGANGVVMINTKGGVAGRSMGFAAPRVEIKTQRGFSDFAFDNLLQGLNETQYKQLYREGYVNSGRLTAAEADALYLVQFPEPANTNWLDEMTQIGITESFDLSAQGGSDLLNYFVSASVFDQQGTVQQNFFTRYSSRANLSAQLSDKLRISNNLSLSYFNQRGITDGTRWQAPFYLAYLMAPTVPIFDSEGLYYADHQSFFMGGNNPVGHLYEDERTLEQTRIIDNLSVSYQVMSTVSLRSIWSFDILNVDEYLYSNMRFGDARRDPGYVQEGRTDIINWQGTQTLNYVNKFGPLHSVDVLIGFENQKITTDIVEAGGAGFSHPDLKTLASAAIPDFNFGIRTAFAFQSYFARANYNLANKYFVSASFRTDGSSRFGPETRWGNFWSFGLGYTLSSESFMQGLTFINYLKFRGSYGQTGNAEIGNFPWAGLYGFNREYDGQPGAAPTQISNPRLTWESQINQNIGLDYAVFDNRISGTVDLFKRESKELLLEEPVSYTTGFRDVERNVGSMENSGIEFLIRADILRTEMIDLSVNFNITKLVNKITELADPIVDGTKRREEGRDFQEYWLYGWAGVDPANGDPLWWTDSSRSETTNDIGNAERFYDGHSASPDSYGSFGLSGRVGRITISAQANYTFGNYLFDSPGWVIHGDGRFTPRSTTTYAFENRWTPDHTDALFPQHRWGGNQSSNNSRSDRYQFKGDFIRLKNVKVAYNVPRSITSVLGLRSLEAYVNLNNYFTWVADEFLHFDPEQVIFGNYNTVTPNSKTASFGINIGL